jgi:hypothetical protein
MASFTIRASWPTIVDLATDFWGQPTDCRRDEIRFGQRQSKCVKPSTNTWFDHETNDGGGYIALWKMARPGQPLPTDNTYDQIPPWLNIDVAYDYQDTNGTLLFQVIRTITASPRFLQRRPNGPGKWIWNIRGIERVPYHLPELIEAAAGSVVLIPEGEKDVDTLRRHCRLATCNPGGAAEHKNKAKPYRGKWLAEFSEHLRGQHVHILPDNDAPGEAHALDIARKLHGIAASVRIVRLPGLPEKGDVSDWLAAGHTVEELNRIADEIPVWEPSHEHFALPIAFSENALSYKFTKQHAETLLYCHGLGQWLRWDEGRWREDHTVSVYSAVRRICAEAGEAAVATEADGKKIARTINKASSISGIERLGRHHPHHARTSDDFDTDKRLLNGPTCANTITKGSA